MSEFSALTDCLLSEALCELFDELSEVLFWVKDENHRILEINEVFARRVNLPRARILGKTDAEFYYPELARVFLADDARVLASGEPIRRKIELLTTSFGGVEWRSTTKLPIRDRIGRVVGTAGISRPLPREVGALPGPYRAFGAIVEYTRSRLSGGVGVRDIARESGMSTATLERRFREHLRLTPSQFLSQLRLSRACELLRDTPLNMTEVARECGYESPAAFSRAFRREMGMAPSRFRETQRS
ncbi:MAG: helix-turn-helix domain-containing protein [Opitutales bacterium]